MIISKLDFLDRVQLDPETLDMWIEEEWLIPSAAATELTFTETDIARAKLILDLIHDLRVNQEGVGVILHLLDQMHGLRKALADMRQFARARSLPHRGVLLMRADQSPE
jgi:chaperone modulatory protein CbpM